jgi:tRNA nucleotidyltransferase (CCA-adding enzyme)
MKLYKVGGCVRDQFLNRPCKDIDLAVEAESFQAMRQGILDMGGEIFQENEEFLTIRAKTLYGATDFVLCRKDGAYRDGRRPESVEPGTIEDDLARRDFTMNAMAADLETGEVIDPFYGYESIMAKLIMPVGDVNERFREDALRVFRAIRFSIVLDFRLCDEITAEIRYGDIDYSGVATERIREELLKAAKVNSFRLFRSLQSLYLSDLVVDRGIWFEPTVKRA